MTNKQQSAKKTCAPASNGRPTIGFFTGFREQFFHLMWCGIADVAREHNVNAICFAGNYVYDPEGFNAQANILYDLIDMDRFDGLVIWGLMCNLLDSDQTQQFYARYRPLPIVSVAQPMAGIANVLVDNYSGMREAIVHLIEVHDCCRIAYIKGLPGFRPHDERYLAYVDVLAEYGLPFDPARVAVPRDTEEMEQPDWGQVALRRLLDEQHAEFDALVTNDDYFVHAMMPDLQARGIRVPDDIALVSFDDTEGSDCLIPPLTTVSLPMYVLGRQAAETLLAQLNGQHVLEQVEVPTRLIVRQSCGCLDPTVAQGVTGLVTRPDVTESLEVSLAGQRKRILAEMIRAAEHAAAGLDPDWAERLLDGFVTALTTAETGEASVRVLSTLDDILRHVLATEGEIEVWQEVLSTLRRHLLPYFSVDEAGISIRDRSEDLWFQAQVIIGKIGHRGQAFRHLQADQRKRIVSEIGTALAATFDVNGLVDILARKLPRLGFSRGYLSLYEDPQPYRYPQPAPQCSRLMLAYDRENPAGSPRVALAPGGQRFPSRQLVPEEILLRQGAYILVVQALYFQDEQIGFLVLDGSQRDSDVYDIMRVQISSALQGALLMQQIQQHQVELANESDLLHTLMNSSPDYLFFKDRESRFLRTNNAHAQQLLGLPIPEEAIGKTDFDLFPREEAQRFFDEEQRIMATGKPVVTREWQLHSRTTGKLVWLSEHKVPIRDAAGHVVGLVGISRNVTAQKQAEAVLQQAKDAAEAANRAKSTFLSNMSHELRTPLNAILGFAQLLARETTLSPAQNEYIDTINHSGEHLLHLINDVLDMSKIEAGSVSVTRSSFDLWQMLADVEEMIRVRADQKGLTFSVESPPNLLRYIESDEKKLRQILINILGNAVKFTEKGSVTLRIFSDIVDVRSIPTSHISHLTFEIIDTGPGIAPQELSAIFEAFRQTSHGQEHEGTGLGLAISRKFAQLLGGDMQVESEMGRGSLFSFDIQVELVEQHNVRPVVPIRTIVGLASSSTPVRILVVDDHTASRRLIHQLLGNVGFDVHEATNGREALTLLDEWRPDLILMDMRMPIMDGYTATKSIRRLEAERMIHPENEQAEDSEKFHIKNLTSNIPIIAMTASAFEEEQQQALAAGCNTLLRKPISVPELFEVIRSYFGVEYIYEADERVHDAHPPKGIGSALTPEALAALPDALLESLRQAVISGKQALMTEAVGAIQKYNPELADNIAHLTHNFKYQVIWEIIQQIRYEKPDRF